MRIDWQQRNKALSYLPQENIEWYANGRDNGGCIELGKEATVTDSQLSVQNVNPLTPNESYKGRTAPLTSKVAFYTFIQQT